MKGIGFVGVGCISDCYLKNITQRFRELRVVGVCDLIRERAEQGAEKYGVGKVYGDMEELFADPEVDIVLNLTRPYEHYEVTKAALLAGKNVYSEKPLSPNLQEARELVSLAAERGLRLGGAPDTFLGAGIQTARRLVDAGFIGTPTAALARLATHGAEHWHPDPEFLYRYGGGPLFDMGPYYVTALVNLLGGVDAVAAMTKTTFDRRTITSSKKYGAVMDVTVPTHYAGVLRFRNGAVAQMLATFDVYTKEHNALEIYGTEGTLIVPDPNTFGGEVKLLRPGSEEYHTIPLLTGYTDNCRALGLADMAKAMETGREHRANSAQQLHVVEVMCAFQKSSDSGSFVTIESPFARQTPMPYTALEGILTD